ncbi:MAG: response regulator [Actinomycetia bacterium]|nr:response regulator [Actinomycetes bacterium]MCP4224345.1 response regulator [Actinomycetes bacterium]MCP5031592.1 response regulator [Actinomycetes bacterium]
MRRKNQPTTVLLVEDNEIDARMVLRAARSSRLANHIQVVTDGAQALDYLHRRPPFADAPYPHLVLLDLNLPGIDGRDVLAEMKADDTLRHIPVVILTSSTLEQDVLASYRGDAAAFVTKPVGLDGFLKVVEAVECFWIDVVTLPEVAVG